MSGDARKTGGTSILILQVKNLMLKNREGICSSLPKFTKLGDATAKTENWVSWMPRLLYLAKLYSSVCKQMMMGPCDVSNGKKGAMVQRQWGRAICWAVMG